MSYGRNMTLMVPRWTPMVKILIIACVATSVLQLGAGADMVSIFGLTPYLVLHKFFLWQLVTYLFLHGGVFHLLFNMLALWMFGSELEGTLGARVFLRFYFVCGVGAGLLSVVATPSSVVPTIGASGSVYGILMAYGMFYPNRIVYLYIFPIPAKYLVAGLAVFAFLSALSQPGGSIAHVAHLGGMLFAYLFLKGWLSPVKIRQEFFRWRLKRMRQRFKVVENKKAKKEDDFWIN